MRLTFLGTCSGTEPMPGRHHVSFTVETGGGVYVFDAGEGCAHTAHVMGVDLLAVRAIFISHPHGDHVGGLPHLLWTMRKLGVISPTKPHKLAGRAVKVLIPDLSAWDGLMKMMAATEGGFRLDWSLEASDVADGMIYDDGSLRVTAMHNTHLGTPPNGRPWRSFSFRIEGEGKAVVYSGDCGGIGELLPLIDAGCDLLLTETGHHRVADVCEFLRERDLPIGQLAFIHHGREILRDPAAAAETARRILGRAAIITEDRMTMEI